MNKANMKETLEEHQRNVAALRMQSTPMDAQVNPGSYNTVHQVKNNGRYLDMPPLDTNNIPKLFNDVDDTG